MLSDTINFFGKRLAACCIVILLGFLFCTIQLAAQNSDIKIEVGKYNPEQIVFVRDLLQDNRGFLWIATENGLFKYDGYNYTQYSYNANDTTGISSNKVLGIEEDRYGKLWIGTENGLNCFNPETERFRHYYADTSGNSISGNIINEIHIDHKDRLWIISEYGGLDKIDLQTGNISNYFYESDSIISNAISDFKDIVSDTLGNLWILGKENGLKSFDIKAEIFSSYTNDSIYPNNKEYRGEGISLEMDKDILWIGTGSRGIGQFNIVEKKFNKPNYELKKNYNRFNSINFSIASIYKVSDTDLWFSTCKDGVFRLSLKKEGTFKGIEKIDHSAPEIQAEFEWTRKVYIDRSGIAWIGGKGNGLMSIFPTYKKIRHYKNIKGDPNSLGFKSVRSVFQDNAGILWVSGYNGFDRIDRKTGNYTHFKDAIYSAICQDRDSPDILWLGHQGTRGLDFLDKKTLTRTNFLSHPEFRKIGANMYAIIDNGDGTLWLGTDMGLRKFHKTTQQIVYYDHDPENANSIVKGHIKLLVEDSYGNLWCATDNNGVSCFNPQSGSFENYVNNPGNPNSIGANSINAIYEDKNKTLWIGTDGGGLNRFNREDNTFTHYLKSSSFPANKIIGILEDNQANLWMSSEAGIIRFNPRTNDIKLYDMSDGLISLNFFRGAQFANNEGELFFGSLNGMVSFFPEEMKDNPNKPDVVLSSLKIFYKDTKLEKHISYLDTLELSYKDEIITFEVSALNFIKPEKNQYKYKLEGNNDDWISLGTKREITFTNLDHGAYVLHVIASNNDGVWNEEGCRLHLIINPPWWLTWWAKSLYVILSVLSLVAFYYAKVSSLKKQKKKLEQQVKERTAEVVQQKEEIEAQAEELKSTNDKLLELDDFKQSMTGMIVHDLKNPLNGIINVPLSYSFENQVLRTKQIGKQMLNMVLNILDVHKYEETKLVVDKLDQSLFDLSNNAINEVAFLADQKNIRIINTLPAETGVKVDQEIIERVFVNILTNAIKYTPNNGNINLTGFENLSGFVKIEISDTGQGIPQDQLPKVFDKFEQLSAKKSGKIRSTGLGLTFCKMAVEAHGGEIGAVSEVENLADDKTGGTTFWFTLPSAKIKPTANQEIKAAYHAQTSTFTLTDDDKKILEPFAVQLKEYAIYDISILRKLLKQIESVENENIRSWKEEMSKAIGSGNDERYQELIETVKA